MSKDWWTQVTDKEADAIAVEHGIYEAHVIDQQGTDRTIKGVDDSGYAWIGKWYDGESLTDIRWHEAG